MLTTEANKRSWKPSGILRSFAIYSSHEIIVPVVVDVLLTTLSYITYSTFNKLHRVIPLQLYPTKIQRRRSTSSKWITMHQTKPIFTMINHSILTQKKNFSLNHTRANHPKCIGWNTTTHLRHLSNENIPLQQNNRNKTIGFCITEKPA